MTIQTLSCPKKELLQSEGRCPAEFFLPHAKTPAGPIRHAVTTAQCSDLVFHARGLPTRTTPIRNYCCITQAQFTTQSSQRHVTREGSPGRRKRDGQPFPPSHWDNTRTPIFRPEKGSPHTPHPQSPRLSSSNRGSEVTPTEKTVSEPEFA